MTASFSVSSRLLNSRLVASPCRDEALTRAFETGDAHTRKASKGLASAVSRVASRFISRGARPRSTSPDREASLKRKRRWAGSSGLPATLRDDYTQGEVAVLTVVAVEVKKHGYCDLAIDRMAAVAGVSRTTCQNALRKANNAERRHVSIEVRPRPGQKNLTNIIRIISSAWLGWLKRSIGFKSFYPTKTKVDKTSHVEPAVRSQGAYEREKAGTAGSRGTGAKQPATGFVDRNAAELSVDQSKRKQGVSCTSSHELTTSPTQRFEPSILVG